MLEDLLVSLALTKEMIAAGSELIDAFDRAGWPVTSALWLFDPDHDEWRLLLALPSVPGGLRTKYEQIHRLIRDLGLPIPSDVVSPVNPNDFRIRLLASVYSWSENVEGRRFKGLTGGYLFLDSYLYRLGHVAPAA